MSRRLDEAAIRKAMEASWSIETAQQWRPDFPVAGQCNVTTVVVHDMYGGKILKTPYSGVDHFYNAFDGIRIDFTDSQFETPIDYEDIPSDRVEASLCLKPGEYETLRKNFIANLDR